MAALEKLLRPLVRLLLSYQITYPQLMHLLKGIYVQVAEQDFKVEGRRQSDSRINLLTGIHRKDVKRLRAESNAPAAAVDHAPAGARLIAAWLGDPEFVDANGAPRALSIKAEPGAEPEFDSLVHKVFRQDIRPRVILDEWLRIGVAHLDNDRLILNTGAFTPDRSFEEKVYFFGKNLQDHIAAGSHNLLGQKPSYFDRSVYYDQLSAESVESLAKLANELGMQALTAMNKAALDCQNADGNRQDADYRINFGIFNFSTQVDSEPEDGPDESDIQEID